MPMTAEEVVRFHERCAAARAEADRQYQVELRKIEAVEKIEQAQIETMEFSEKKFRIDMKPEAISVLAWLAALEAEFDPME